MENIEDFGSGYTENKITFVMFKDISGLIENPDITIYIINKKKLPKDAICVGYYYPTKTLEVWWSKNLYNKEGHLIKKLGKDRFGLS